MTNKSITVLLVDDEISLLESVRRRLEYRGFKVIAVNSGEEALKVAQAEVVDVAIIDVKMPGMDGKEVMQRLKHDHPEMGVIMVTGHGSFSFKEEEVSGMIDACLAKPCDLATLQEAIQSAARKRSDG